MVCDFALISYFINDCNGFSKMLALAGIQDFFIAISVKWVSLRRSHLENNFMTCTVTLISVTPKHLNKVHVLISRLITVIMQ